MFGLIKKVFIGLLTGLVNSSKVFILHAFLLINTALLIAVSIYCYLIKYQAKNLWPIHDTNDKLNKFFIDCINGSHTYYFFADIINIRDFDPNNIKTDEKSYKIILIYYAGCATIKKDLKIHSVNPLYLIFSDVKGYFEEINGNKYLMLVPTNESEEKSALIRLITKKNLHDYYEKYMKVKFDSDDNLPLNKTIENAIVTIVIRAGFLFENNKYYSPVFLDEYLSKI